MAAGYVAEKVDAIIGSFKIDDGLAHILDVLPHGDSCILDHIAGHFRFFVDQIKDIVLVAWITLGFAGEEKFYIVVNHGLGPGTPEQEFYPRQISHPDADIATSPDREEHVG